MIDIRDIQGNILKSVPITQSCQKIEELMVSDYIQLSWNSDSNEELQAGCYIEHNGEKFSLLEPYKPTQKNEVEFTYTPQFKSKVMAWSKVPFFFYTTNEDKITKEPDWTLTSNPADFMKCVCDALKNETGEDWTYIIDASLPASASLSFNTVDVFSSLNEIARAFETEWYADKVNNILYLGKASFGESVTLEVGDNIKVPSVNNTREGYYTRFYAFGSTRNITQNYEGSNVNNLVNKRLTLDPIKYPNGYKDIRADLRNGEIFSKVLVFEDVYPSSNLSISSVRTRLMYRVDGSGNKIQIGTDENGNPIYDQYAIWYFRINGFEFDPKNIIQGQTLSVHFQTGALAGREFELKYYESKQTITTSDGLKFDVQKGDYEILFVEEGNYIIPSLVGLVPSEGDEVVLFNIEMPSEYTQSAYDKLESELDKEIERLTSNLNNYSFNSNPVAFNENNPNLTIGRNVTYKNGDETLNTRVIKLTTQLDFPIEQNITIGNEKIKGNTQQLKEEVATANKDLNLLSVFNDMTSSLQQSYARTQQMMLDGFAAIKNMWQLREDDNGNRYIYSAFHVATEGGVTMYRNLGFSNIPSIYDGLPIDNNTIYWENGILKAKGGGGVAESVSWADITGKPEWLLDNKISYSEIEGTPDLSVYALNRSLSAYVTKTELSNLDYADKDWVKEYVVDINTGNITAITKKMVIEALGYTPYDNTNPNGYVTSDSIPSLDGYATEDWVIKKGYLTSIPSEYVTESELTAKGYATALSVNAALGNKVDKVEGKGLSTEDFTTALKTKLNGLSNYDDTVISNAITQLRRDFDTLVDGDASTAIDTFNEIIAFLDGIQDNQDLSSIIASIEQQIAAKYTQPSGGIPKSDLVQAVQTSLGKADSALQSHQSIYTLTFQSGTFASGSFTANSGNKTINIPTTTSHVSEGNNLYFTNARAVSALGDTLKSYVTLSGPQTVSGEKNFTGGIKVNGSPIVYDAAKKYWKLEGDLLITGGLTMYGSDSSFTPSTIMDAISVDGTTISKDGGVLRVIGGGGISSITKQMVIDALGFTPISSSDVPTALPNPHSLKFGSKLYDGSSSKTILASDLGITWDDILGRPTLLSSFTDDVVAGKYLPLSGGTITGEIKFNISNLASSDISPNIIATFKAPRVQANDLFVDTITLGTTSGTASSIPLKIRKYSKITSLNPDGITDLVIVDPNGSVNIGTTTHPCELNVEGDAKANRFVATSNNGLRLAYGDYGTLLRNDGDRFFILLTNKGDALNGSFNTLRPFGIDLATGDIQMESNVFITKSFKLSTRLRVDAREAEVSFGYLKSNIANANNVGIAHLGTNYGGTTDMTKEDYDMTAISMYRGIVGIGKEYDYTSLRAIYDAGVDLGLTKGLLIGSAKVLYENNELNISTSAYINGNVLTTGGITMYSQRSLKNVVDERGLSLDELSAIKPTRYTWKDGRDNRIHFGGIADDIQQVLPEVVYNANGVLTMDYGNAGFAIASSLIKPVVDHEQRIKALEKENEELKQEIKRLRA